MGFSLGGLIGAVSAPFVEAGQGIAQGVGNIASGNVGTGLKDIGGGIVQSAKAATYEAGFAGINSVSSGLKNDPVGVITSAAQIAGATGGIPPDAIPFVQAGAKVLQPPTPQSQMSAQPQQVVTQAPPAASYVGDSSSSALPLILIGGAVFLIFILRRK